MEKKPLNPWTIVGWIVLAMIVLPIGACVAGVAAVSFLDYRAHSIEARQ